MNSEAKKWVKSKVGRIHNFQDPCAPSALTIILKRPHKEQNDETTYIRQIGKEKMSQEVLPDIPVQLYRGPSKPEMPYGVSTKSPLPLRVLTRQLMSASRTEEIDNRGRNT